jgi:hypothetical protein
MSDRLAGPPTIRRGAPALVAAALIPVVAVMLVALGWSRGTGPDDPVGPGLVAAVTLLGAGLLSWRAATQRARLDPDDLWCRNLTVGFAVEWDRVEALRVLRRAPLVVVEVRVADLRRSHRVGAATRFVADADGVSEVLATLRAHPRAAAVLEEDAP